MSMSRDFFDWVDYSLRHDECSSYNNYTCINFSGGTYVMFNYKGEVEGRGELRCSNDSSFLVVGR